MKKDLILVKLGGSLITDKSKPYTANMSIIKRLAKEIHEARQEKEISLIVAHGGGSFPHVSAKKYQTQKGIINEKSYEGIAVTQNDAAKLNRIIVDELLKAGENAISIQPSSVVIAKNSRIIEWDIKVIEKLLEYNLLPIPYGDVGIDIEKGCCVLSTEEVLTYLAKKLKANLIIMAGNVDGVFTADPIKNKNANFIPVVDSKNFEEIKKYLKGSYGTDVTGGMLLKVEKMLELAKQGFEIEIINATKPEYLKRVLLGERDLGTTIKK